MTEDATPRTTHMLTVLLHVAIGAALGYGYHRLVGCRTGACLITANPYVSTLYGGVMGFLMSGRG